MKKQDITSLADLAILGKELLNPYVGVNTYVTSILSDTETTLNTINSLISQPDYLTYATQEEQDYYTTLVTYLQDFINNFPTLTE